ncbi:hypothetical protein CAF53_16810 [Sphingobium sp. LB126]|uniref:hypothetical protein n=1 Tax=Sphingobium sp. LB126 TaxID=1983755 RepID=UPI000C20F916|nr:hypothetical protein [Sphingobium sp. LB126]PJG45906.1 hypothetical protein CAF53_16810 [Sphingobium sp. LB126]
MISQTTHKSVIFSEPFQLPEFETPLPAGTYDVETEEEVLEGNVHTALRRIATTLRIRNGAAIERHPVDPEHLYAAWKRDQKAARAGGVPPANWPGTPVWVQNIPSDGSR